MFLESSYQPQIKETLDELTIYDVAILTAQIGDKPFLKINSPEHLTAGMVQLACYFAQGKHMAHTGRSLFRDDFFVIDNRIESPKITDLFGSYDTQVTPFFITEAIKALLTPVYKGFGLETNLLCQKVIFETVPRDYKELMKELRETRPYQEALKNPFKKIDKAHVKEYFDAQIIAPSAFSDFQIGLQEN